MRSFQVNMTGTRCHLFMWIRRTVGRHFTGTLCQGLAPRNTTKGWIVIPKKLRDRYNIQPGGKVMLSEAEGALKIIPLPKDPVQDFRGILKDTQLLTELLNSRREDSAREELRIGQLRAASLLPK